MTKSQAYKDGLQSALEDWSLAGIPHRTRDCPEVDELKRTAWFLGRCHGFQEAESLLKKDTEKDKEND